MKFSHDKEQINFDKFDTGDLILFSGNSWLSYLVEYFGYSKYCHIGMVLKDPVYIDPSFIGLYYIESGFELFPECENNKIELGVQIHKLQDIINKTNSNIFVRHITCERDISFYTTMDHTHQIVHGKPYNLCIKDWIEAKYLVDNHDIENTIKTFDITKAEYQKTSTFWCSALVAFFYDQLGFLDETNDIPWTLIAPKEFSVKSSNIIKFKNCILGEEIQIK